MRTVGALLLLSGWAFAQYGPCKASGVVEREDSGQPVARARLLFSQAGRPGAVTLGYFTDEQGRFEAFGLDAAAYAVNAQKPGFVEVVQPETEQVRLSGRCAASGLRYVLSPAAVVSGRIVDPNGRPQAMATVDAMRRAWVRRRWQFLRYSTVVASADGRYRLAGLPLGTYALRAHPAGPVTVKYGEGSGSTQVAVPAYYPGVYEAARAQLVQVNAPGEVGGFDFGPIMTSLFRVEGRVLPAEGRPMPLQCHIALRPTGSADVRSYEAQYAVETGAFSMAEIPPGSYRLTAYGADAEGITSGVQSIDLQGNDALGVTLALEPAGQVAGRARLASGTPAGGGVWLKLKPVTALPATDDEGAVDPEGRFQFSFVLHERYHLIAGSTQPNVYLRSAEADGRPVDGTLLDWMLAPPRQLEVVLGDDAGRVEGVVRTRVRQAVRGFAVALVPADLSKLAGAEVLTQPTQANGAFRLTNVPPGDYYAYAFAFLKNDRGADPAMLADPLWVPGYRGRPTVVHVPAYGHATVELETQPLP